MHCSTTLKNQVLISQCRLGTGWGIVRKIPTLEVASAVCTRMMRSLHRVILLLLCLLVKLISNPHHERKELTVLMSYYACQGFLSCHRGINGDLFLHVALFSFSVSCGGGVQIDGFELRRTAIQMGARRLMKSCLPETHSANSPHVEKCLILKR